ncbi:22973_t:CDS:2, partial [Dentiscutata erythropus]
DPINVDPDNRDFKPSTRLLSGEMFNSGIISKLTRDNISIVDPNVISSNVSFMITTIPTITGDYAILSVNSSLVENNISSLATRTGLYMTTIPYNQPVSNNQVLLYELAFSNLTFLGLYCDIAPNGIGYICIIEISNNQPQPTYIKVKFLTSASVMNVNILSNMPNISNTEIMAQVQGFEMQAMAFGGYILYAMNKNHEYYIWPYSEDSNEDNIIKPYRLGPYSANNYTTNALYNNISQNNLNAANNSGYGNLQIVKIDPQPMNTTTSSDKIIPVAAAAVVNTILYLASRSNTPDKYKQRLNVFTAGVFTVSHTSLTSIFSFQYVNNYPKFSLPSKILWITPLVINITVFTYIICKGGINGKRFLNLIIIGLTLYNSETSLLINQSQLKEMFDNNKNFEATAKYRGLADILLKSIPQLFTQHYSIPYTMYNLLYDFSFNCSIDS